jgi:hypothetical protein
LLSILTCVPSSADGESIVAVVAPVLQIISELQEFSASPPLPLSMEHMKVDLPMTLRLHEQLDVASAPIPAPSTHNPDALFAKELCNMVNSFEPARPRLGRGSDCLHYLIMGTKFKYKRKNVCDFPRTGIRNGMSLKYK